MIAEEDRFQLQETGFSCNSDLETDVCITTKDVRIDTQSLHVYISSSRKVTSQVKGIKSVKPYPKKTDNTAMGRVRPLQIVQVRNSRLIPKCDHTHMVPVPVVIFSSGGFSDNIFHVISEMIIPLFLTSWHFRSQVQFIITDYSPLWVEQYGRVLKRLSAYEVVNADNGGVHCFPGGVIGLKYHQFLGINSTKIPKGYNYDDFRRFLFDSYDLKVNTLLVNPSKPIVVLISREGSRMLLNENEIVNMMVELGFEVRIVIPSDMSDLETFSSLVNSCHVLVGVHGAGIVNEVFLPKGALVVEIIPIGLEWQSTNYYAKPASRMGLKYLKYHVGLGESSLNGSYSPDDPVIIDPSSIYAKGYLVAKAIYLDGQNLRLNVTNKFRDTMSYALDLLQH
ncbi:beta-1,2-xylosyltransferease XAX1-like [Silene latifolia]|uniref:beta-1,2-xylosyltransferease XAX1-like n=1 Tax=Silene latifolia TaxID=37657 RepID=UPI003D789099